MDNRQKVLVLSYFFPPCNLTPSERIHAWASYFHKQNYYPIIITRNWDVPIANATTAIFQSSGKETRSEHHEHFEVHYVPYRQNLRDKLFTSLYGKKSYIFYLLLTFVWNILQLCFFRLSSSYEMYRFARRFLRSHPDVRLLIVSVSPFELLGMAHKLCRMFGLQWLADYRDDWSTNEMQYADSVPKKILKQVYAHFEKNWLQSATFFTTVSETYRKKLSAFLGKEGVTVANGFMPFATEQKKPLNDCFTIAYLGSLYSSQPVELFLSAYKKLINSGATRIKIIFIGLGKEPPIRKRIETALKGYESYMEITDRIPKQQALEIQQGAHALLAVSYTGKTGIPGSKLYDYIALQKKVILCPSDHDIMEETLHTTGQGILCNDEEDVFLWLQKSYDQFLAGTYEDLATGGETEIYKYSREYQTNLLTDGMKRFFKPAQET